MTPSTLNTFWETTDSLLEKGQNVFLTLVADHTQHSPGTTGAKLLVAKDIDPMGTIGGGIMEYNILKRAKKILDQGSFTPEVQTLVHRKSGTGEKSGMICAGKQTNLYYLCQPEKDGEIFKKILTHLNGNDSAILSINTNGMNVQKKEPCLDQPQIKMSIKGTDWRYEEQLMNFKRIAIIGGGHCSLALSRLMKQLGYDVFIFDTRENVSTVKENKYARSVQIVDDFQEAGKQINFPELTNVVVMTTDVVSDVRGLLGAKDLPFHFIGVMGSQPKIAEIIEQLKSEDISNDQLSKFTAPVGIPMASNTPEEIAVSVAAQILQNRDKSVK
ncbi:MAG TPA: hypothetical protein EYN82_02110 [Candidatus Marinimicrobia bacterium]|nr:hypothetical protein [Candidatus Neomarinimicrobiota bacterium]